MNTLALEPHDALLIVDVQNDFLPGGKLAVPNGDQVIPALNRYIAAFSKKSLPVFASRDWHPANHCSFAAQGGRWPPHCVAGSEGAGFAAALALPASVTVISKAETPENEAYSAFQGTGLATRLRTAGVKRIFIGGLATDYCVLHTVNDALEEGFAVELLSDAIRAVDVQPGDGEAAVREMTRHGAHPSVLSSPASG